MPDDDGRRNPRQVRDELAEAADWLQAGEITPHEAERIAREAGADLAEIRQALKPAGRRNPRPPARKVRLTKRSVADLPLPPEGAAYAVAWDADEPGFVVRVLPSGKRTYFWQGRVRGTGRSVKVTLGNAAKVTPEQARQKAKQAAAQADLGDDPAAALKAKRAERERPPERTMADLWRHYEREHLPDKRDSSQEGDRRLWHLAESGLGKRKIADVTAEELDRLRRDVTLDRGPYAANRVLSLLSVMFSLAVRTKWRPDNPCKGLRRNPEEGRERFLAPEEIARLMGVLEAQGDLAAKAVELLLLTGARRGEVLGATWDQFDLSGGVWTKPASLTKSKRRHRVPLSPEAVALLAGLPTRAAERGPFATLRVWELQRRWDAIRAEAGLPDVRIHDLRHSFASVLIQSGLSLPVVGKLLGHSGPHITARYAHLDLGTLREATARVGAAVRGDGGNVVELPAKKGAS